jgi:hypothetical protein
MPDVVKTVWRFGVVLVMMAITVVVLQAIVVAHGLWNVVTA